MIGKDELTRAVCDSDALAEEHNDLPGHWRRRGVDIDALAYVATQRGLRSTLLLTRGRAPKWGERLTVSLSLQEQRLQIAFAAAFMDGFAVRDEVERGRVNDA